MRIVKFYNQKNNVSIWFSVLKKIKNNKLIINYLASYALEGL